MTLPQCKKGRSLLPLLAIVSVWLLFWEIGLHEQKAEERDKPQGFPSTACSHEILPFPCHQAQPAAAQLPQLLLVVKGWKLKENIN